MGSGPVDRGPIIRSLPSVVGATGLCGRFPRHATFGSTVIFSLTFVGCFGILFGRGMYELTAVVMMLEVYWRSARRP